MRHILTFVLVLASGMLVGACPKDTPIPVDAPPPVQVDPTFASIQEMIFTPRCSVTACHDNNTPASSLNLLVGTAYGELVNVNPITTTARNAGRKLVDPGNPDNSFLIFKLEGVLGTGDGRQMPQNSFPLYPEEIAPIRQWITNGALEN